MAINSGDIKVYILDNGTMEPYRAEMIETEGPPTMIIPCYTVLIKHPEGNILFDAATHDEVGRQHPEALRTLKMTKDQRLPDCLAPIGVAAEEINYLVLSHMHPDHMGYIDKFPNAKIYVSDVDFTNNVKTYALGKSHWEKDIEFFLKAKLDWVFVPEQEQTIKLFDGVTIYNFGPGHSFGMLGMLVELPKTGNIMLVSDAICLIENVGPPVRATAYTYNREAYINTLNKILQIAKEKNAQIWYGHDIEWFNGMTKSDQGCYE